MSLASTGKKCSLRAPSDIGRVIVILTNKKVFIIQLPFEKSESEKIQVV